jgi:hypothetical protein
MPEGQRETAAVSGWILRSKRRRERIRKEYILSGFLSLSLVLLDSSLVRGSQGIFFVAKSKYIC